MKVKCCNCGRIIECNLADLLNMTLVCVCGNYTNFEPYTNGNGKIHFNQK